MKLEFDVEEIYHFLTAPQDPYEEWYDTEDESGEEWKTKQETQQKSYNRQRVSSKIELGYPFDSAILKAGRINNTFYVVSEFTIPKNRSGIISSQNVSSQLEQRIKNWSILGKSGIGYLTSEKRALVGISEEYIENDRVYTISLGKGGTAPQQLQDEEITFGDQIEPLINVTNEFVNTILDLSAPAHPIRKNPGITIYFSLR